MAPRTLAPGQRTEVWIHDIEAADDALLYTSSEILFEAPNWTPDGSALIINGNGGLWRLAVDGGSEPVPINLGGIGTINNDHVLSPDGQTIYVSCDDGHIYAMPATGATAEQPPRRVTNDPAPGFRHFLHGVSPDNTTLAYTGLQLIDPDDWSQGFHTDVYTVPTAGGPDDRLTHGNLSGEPSQYDGPEYGPRGRDLWFNSERMASHPGHAQLFRMDLSTGAIEQLTDDERVNWFPHISPNGRRVVYISFPPGTLGHPADLDVILRELVFNEAGAPTGHRDLVELFGGQGTINVNSWAPDSRRFGYVRYPIA